MGFCRVKLLTLVNLNAPIPSAKLYPHRLVTVEKIRVARELGLWKSLSSCFDI